MWWLAGWVACVFGLTAPHILYTCVAGLSKHASAVHTTAIMLLSLTLASMFVSFTFVSMSLSRTLLQGCVCRSHHCKNSCLAYTTASMFACPHLALQACSSRPHHCKHGSLAHTTARMLLLPCVGACNCAKEAWRAPQRTCCNDFSIQHTHTWQHTC